MNDFYTFIVTSTINSPHSSFTPVERFQQTLETLFSIRKRVPTAKIVFVDNSIVPLDENQKVLIEQAVDLFVLYENNLFTRHVNKTGFNKGINELFQMEVAFQEMKKRNLIGKRIFKISGRYRLNDAFNSLEYEKEEYFGKYVFKITTWIFNYGQGDEYRDFFCTVLWSFCSSLLDEYQDLMFTIFERMIGENSTNLEIAHNMLIPRDKLILIGQYGAEGYITNGEFTQV